MSKLKQVEEEALKLPAEERARLAHRLLESTAQTSDGDVEMAWIAEAERRREELLSRPAVAEPAEIAFQRTRDAIGDKR